MTQLNVCSVIFFFWFVSFLKLVLAVIYITQNLLVIPWHNDQIVRHLTLYSFPNLCSKPFRWQESLFRFKHIFSLNEQRTKSQIPIYYLSGNHDIGYSAFHSVHPEVINHSCPHSPASFPFTTLCNLMLLFISKIFYFSSHTPLDKARLPCH